MKLLFALTSLAAILLTASSCNKLDTKSIPKAFGLIQGTWRMTKVENKVHNDGTMGKNDVSNNFNGWFFDFREDNTVSLTIPEENLTLEGQYELYETYVYDSEGDRTTVMNLNMYYFDPSDITFYREFTWTDMSVNSSTFKAQEIRFIGSTKTRYFYELGRI